MHKALQVGVLVAHRPGDHITANTGLDGHIATGIRQFPVGWIISHGDADLVAGGSNQLRRVQVGERRQDGKGHRDDGVQRLHTVTTSPPTPASVGSA
jgi:hypothetical protein